VTTTSVRFYMALVVYNRPDMAVAFPVRAEGGGSCRRRWSSPSPSPKAKTKSTHPPPLETPRPQIHTKNTQHLMPRLEILTPVYRRVHFLLTGEGGGDGEGGGGKQGTAAEAATTATAATTTTIRDQAMGS
jgi:hypothetical protein